MAIPNHAFCLWGWDGTQGLLLGANVHAAGVQDRDGGVSLPAMLFGRFPFLEKRFADRAYQRPIFADALGKIMPRLEIEIVKRSGQAKGLVVVPKRWIVDGSTTLRDPLTSIASLAMRAPSRG